MLRGLAGLSVLGAGGCGFRPLYGPGGGVNADPGVVAELRQVRVGVIGERYGQLLRRALYQKMYQGVGGPVGPKYELRLSPGMLVEGVGIQLDGTATRVRFIGVANWLLVRLGPPVEGMNSGVERAIEAFNIPPNQFFASDSSREAAEARMADLLAELVVTRVALEFRRRADGVTASGTPIPVPEALPAPTMPTRPGSANEPFGQVIPGLSPTGH